MEAHDLQEVVAESFDAVSRKEAEPIAKRE